MSTQAISATSGRTSVSTSATSSSAGSTSSLTLSQRRALLSSSSSRPSSSLGGSSSLANNKTQRPPVLLQFTETTLRCGFAGDALPKDIIPLCLFAAATSTTTLHDSSTTTTTTTSSQNRGEPCPLRDSAAVWYRYLAPLLQYAYQRLGLLVAASTTTTRGDRKVVVLYREWEETTMPRVVEHALLAVLIQTLQVPAVSLQGAAWSMIPSSFPMLSHLLVVHVGLDQASVVVHAAGETLRFTYQSVSLAETRAEFAATPQASSSSLDHALYLDDTHPNSLLVAMLKALKACPRMDRKSVVQNLVFAGTGLLTQPHIPLLVARQLQAVLAQAAATSSKSTRRTPQTTTTTTETTEEEDPAANTEDTTQQPLSLSSSTMIPLSVSSWAGDLHAHVGLVTCPVQPDHVVWLGASGWAASWFAKDPTLTTNAVEWRTEWPPTAAAALSQ